MLTPTSEKSNEVEVELDLIQKEEESSGETSAFQRAMLNLYPGPFFKDWVIGLLVVFILTCIPLFYYAFMYSPLVIMSLFSFPPVVLVLWLIFWRLDRDKATFSGIAKFYLLGVVVIIPVLIIEYIELIPWLWALNDGGKTDRIGLTIGFFLYMSFLVAAFTEENAKFICYFALRDHNPTITHPYTVVILMASSALGFASFENYGYIFSAAIQGDIIVTLMTIASRALLSLPLHTITAILIGCNMSQHYFKNALDCKIYWQTLWQPLLLHGVFDLLALVGALGDYFMLLYIANVIIVVGGIWFCYKKINEVKAMLVDTLV